MKSHLYSLLIFTVYFLILLPASGQTTITELDSIAVVKPKIRQNIYQFVDFGSKEIQFRDDGSVLVKDPSTPALNGFGSAVFTSLTGLRSSSGKEGYWNISGVILCNDTLPDWYVTINCEGYLEKERQRVRNDDGSWSIETNKTNVYFWDKDPKGIVKESADTICFFRIKQNVPKDALFSGWNALFFQEPAADNKEASKRNFRSMAGLYAGQNYEISGKFRDQEFVIIQTSSNRKVWIFLNGSLVCMFQGDLDYAGMTKKYRNLPYLMINKAIPACDRRNIFRLAILSRYFNTYLASY